MKNIIVIVLMAFGLGFVAVVNKLSRLESKIKDLESQKDAGN